MEVMFICMSVRRLKNIGTNMSRKWSTTVNTKRETTLAGGMTQMIPGTMSVGGRDSMRDKKMAHTSPDTTVKLEDGTTMVEATEKNLKSDTVVRSWSKTEKVLPGWTKEALMIITTRMTTTAMMTTTTRTSTTSSSINTTVKISRETTAKESGMERRVISLKKSSGDGARQPSTAATRPVESGCMPEEKTDACSQTDAGGDKRLLTGTLESVLTTPKKLAPTMSVYGWCGKPTQMRESVSSITTRRRDAELRKASGIQTTENSTRAIVRKATSPSKEEKKDATGLVATGTTMLPHTKGPVMLMLRSTELLTAPLKEVSGSKEPTMALMRLQMQAIADSIPTVTKPSVEELVASGSRGTASSVSQDTAELGTERLFQVNNI